MNDILKIVDIVKSDMNEGEEKRYVATLEMYIYAKDDKSAIKEAQKIAKELDRKYDNDADVTELVEQPTGTMTSRQIKL